MGRHREGGRRWSALARVILADGLRLGAEIGVKSGRNIAETLRLCPDFRWFAVDPWDPGMAYPGDTGPWTAAQIRQNEARFDAMAAGFPDRVVKMQMYSADAAGHIDDGTLDLVFIDALHTREAVAEDIRLWLPKVRPGGWIGGHDYGHPRFPGVAEAVDEAFAAVEAHEDHVWLARV